MKLMQEFCYFRSKNVSATRKNQQQFLLARENYQVFIGISTNGESPVILVQKLTIKVTISRGLIHAYSNVYSVKSYIVLSLVQTFWQHTATETEQVPSSVKILFSGFVNFLFSDRQLSVFYSPMLILAKSKNGKSFKL